MNWVSSVFLQMAMSSTVFLISCILCKNITHTAGVVQRGTHSNHNWRKHMMMINNEIWMYKYKYYKCNNCTCMKINIYIYLYMCACTVNAYTHIYIYTYETYIYIHNFISYTQMYTGLLVSLKNIGGCATDFRAHLVRSNQLRSEPGEWRHPKDWAGNKKWLVSSFSC